ncbi:hypothetical protein [Campylobacter armoricus]|uniref:SGNH/GDSL hydrolase family protein n=1 Tax=Campylobacter armoricus TaxID=2505970 RepID=A0A7L5HZC1_9BACT|nr:hypothetical protein [Campylobacter armoricus]QKF79231.1 hypothetical protein CARM_0275 [Campylobacter armoricus]
MKKNIILLGGSSFLIQNGFSSVFNIDEISFANLSLGGTTSIQLLYELKKEKNRKLFENADLIILNSNVNEIQSCANEYERLPLELIYRDMEFLFLELNKLNKRTLVLITPFFFYCDIVNKVNSIVKYLTKKYSFNLIDMQKYYEKYNLEDIAKAWDGSHQFGFIMRELATNILGQIENFKKTICLSNYPKLEFKIYCFSEHRKHTIQNSFMSEQYLRIKNGNRIKFDKKYYGYKILAIHTWNNTDNTNMNKIMKKDWNTLVHTISPFVLENRKIRISKPTNFMNMIVSIQKEIYVDDFTFIFNSEENNFSEFYHNARTWEPFNTANHLDLVSVLLLNGELIQDDLDKVFASDNTLSSCYDFEYLIPPIEKYKEIINEYCLIANSRTLKQDNQASFLKDVLIKIEEKLSFQTKYGTAKTRIQNQLSYKLGQSMIANSKSFLGYLIMPIALLSIIISFKQEQKIYQEKIKEDFSLKLPPLENYPDYKEALKEKECLTYKLGQALIQANKNWYGGGYIKLLFEIRKLKKRK